MASVGIRELRQNLSKYLELVKAGENLLVTDRGEPVARLVPASHEGYVQLAASFGASLPIEPLESLAARLAPSSRPAGASTGCSPRGAATGALRPFELRVASRLLRVELRRLALREGLLADADQLLLGVALLPLDEGLLGAAEGARQHGIGVLTPS